MYRPYSKICLSGETGFPYLTNQEINKLGSGSFEKQVVDACTVR
jgi:hypothetical protein